MASLDRHGALAIAPHRWFTAVELDFLLQNFQSVGFSLTHDRDTAFPASGQFYFFPKRNYKTDGYEWVRKKGRDSVREDMVRLSVEGVHVVTGRYTYSLAMPGLCRRTYEHVTNGNTICMVHYRLCPLEELPKRAAISGAAKVREEAEERGLLLGDRLDDRLVEELLSCAEQMGLSFSDSAVNTSAHSDSHDVGNDDSFDTIGMGSFNPLPFVDSSESNSILDFEPRRHYPAAGEAPSPGTAVIVCLSLPLSGADMFSIVFGDGEFSVPAVYLSPYTLKCTVPWMRVIAPRSLHFSITAATGERITPPSAHPFTFSAEVPLLNSQINPLISIANFGSNESNDAYIFSQVRKSVTIPGLQVDGHRLAGGVVMEEAIGTVHSNSDTFFLPPPLLSPSFPDTLANRLSGELNPELGMRFVEKLGSVAAVLGGSNSVKRDREDRLAAERSDQISLRDGVESMQPPWSDGWLDDRALNKLSNAELHELVDSFIGTYMSQLVQLASVDAELRQELNLVDESGYALIHYCSMYDLPDLVEALLRKSATDTSIRSFEGLTPLHIAAESRHENVVRILLSYGADCNLLDNYGMTASQRAIKAGHGELASFLESFCSTAGNSSQQLQFSYRSEVLSEDSADMNCSRIISEGIATLPDAQHNLYSPLITKKKAEPAIDSPDKKIIEQSSGTVSPRIFASPEHTSATSISGNLNLLQAALSSLSLTDKCALSLSLGPSPSSPRMHDSMDVELPMNFGSNFANSDGGSKIFEDIDAVFDSQSVLSEIDMESLDVAMSMMGPQELAKVESEVKLIQSNVRTWILRKNYTNLRDAARVLQTAWRVKKKDGSSDSSASSSRVGVTSPANRKKRRTSEEHIQEVVEMKNGPSYSECNMQLDSSSEKLSSAAATLQAVTRGMLARKTFENAKRQGMASLVIQKSLVHWWMQSKESVIGQGSTQKIS